MADTVVHLPHRVRRPYLLGPAWTGKAQARDAALRAEYLRAALPQIPRLLGNLDRAPFHATYGCLDRQFWHYRTADFPSEMYQEGVLPLALVYAERFPGNRWHGEPRIRELALAALRFSARSSHADGSCDDYYPYERALGAAVFSLHAAARACELLAVAEGDILAWLKRRARWVATHDESGRLANHQALAALGLARTARLTADAPLAEAARARLKTALAWQSEEGWFEEYGGADPGYQTVTLDCLAQLRGVWNDARLDEPLARGLRFARLFLHPDDSYGGEYGSRGTHHFYPHGCELLAPHNADAADLAEGFLRALAAGKQGWFDDDRLFAHRLGNLLEAYRAWSPLRAAADAECEETVVLPQAGMAVRRRGGGQLVVSLARGGAFKHFGRQGRPQTDAGLVLELADGRVAVSQQHDRSRACETQFDADDNALALRVSGPLHLARHETATPGKLIVFRLLLCGVGRWSRGLVRRLLQRRLITGRKPASILHTRTIETRPAADDPSRDVTRVVDRIELCDPRITVRRMWFGVDHQTAYVAASGVYQDAALQAPQELTAEAETLNALRQVSIERVLT